MAFNFNSFILNPLTQIIIATAIVFPYLMYLHRVKTIGNVEIGLLIATLLFACYCGATTSQTVRPFFTQLIVFLAVALFYAFFYRW